MRKVYPYLDNPYINNINDQVTRRAFLEKIDDFVNQKQYVRITLLNWQENGIKEIEGELTSGNITKDGSSTARRVCNFSCSVNGSEYSVEDANMDFSINKKIFVEVGIKNYTDEYPEYPILWFPQGVFYITGINISSSTTTPVNLTIQLKDKMAGLNGEIGGIFPVTTVLDSMDTQSVSGEYITEKVLLYNLIVEMVNHIGGEQLQNILVEDVPLRIQRIVRWLGNNPLWMQKQSADDGNTIYYDAELESPSNANDETWVKYSTGDDVGYINDDFVYTGELVAAPGETVTSILDKIVQYLGNYEYFYDEFGIFHFREIKNYLNTTQATVVTDIQEANDYLIDITTGKSVFNFTDNKNLTNITVNPDYSNIKNDYVIQGLRQSTTSSVSHPIIYHLAIDYKPQVGNAYKDLLIYESPMDKLIKADFPLHCQSLPEVGNFNILYMLDNNYKMNGQTYESYNNSGLVYFWNENCEYQTIEPIAYYPKNDSRGYVTTDWRTEIYLRGLLANNLGTDASYYYTNLVNTYGEQTPTDTAFSWLEDIFNISQHEKIDIDYYYEELQAFWPEIYDLEHQRFWVQDNDKNTWHTALTNGNYYLDFIDPSVAGLGEFCVSNIGRRSLNVYNEDLNCLFQPQIPDINFINLEDKNAEQERNECRELGLPWTNVRGEIYSALGTGGYSNACFDELKYQLFLHTNYAKTLSLSALPAFYLEPNSRVTVNDASTNTYGDYMVSSVTIPFGAGQIMSVSANECNMDRLQ